LEIVVNTRLLIKNKLEGIGRFTFETLKLITQQHPNDHFYFLFDRDYDEDFIFSDNITPIILSPQARHPFLFYYWLEFSVAPLLNKLKPDLYLSPDGFLCIGTNVKQIAVFHDLNFMHYPKDVPWLVKKYYHYFYPKFAKKASRIATVSNFSKNDISKTFGIDESKIDVVYNAANINFKILNQDEILATRDKYSAGVDYFLFVGSLHPRKNIINLLKAFDLFKKELNSAFKLIIVGAKYFWTKEMEQSFKNLAFKSDVIFTGRILDEEVYKLTASARAVTYIPYFEGFGIPIIEAMQSGVPVITSKITSMPEVAGNAALLVNPFDVNEISEAMFKINSDENLRTELIESGIKRAKDFSWQKSADLLWQCIKKA
jgi:glycosyltransferase involved in cell wall biosynthesis